MADIIKFHKPEKEDGGIGVEILFWCNVANKKGETLRFDFLKDTETKQIGLAITENWDGKEISFFKDILILGEDVDDFVYNKIMKTWDGHDDS